MNASEALTSRPIVPGTAPAARSARSRPSTDPVTQLLARGDLAAPASCETGERRLRWAVLIDAIAIYCNGPGSGAKRRARWLQERRWFLANNPGHPFSFVSVCDALGLDPGYVRRAVARAAQVQAAGMPTHRHAPRERRAPHLRPVRPVRRGNVKAVC